MPCEIARKVAIDLVKGDSARAELAATQHLLEVTETKVSVRDQVIDLYITKEQNYSQQIDLYKQKENKYVETVTGLGRDNKKLKRGVKVLGTTAGVLLVTTFLGFLAH